MEAKKKGRPSKKNAESLIQPIPEPLPVPEPVTVPKQSKKTASKKKVEVSAPVPVIEPIPVPAIEPIPVTVIEPKVIPKRPVIKKPPPPPPPTTQLEPEPKQKSSPKPESKPIQKKEPTNFQNNPETYYNPLAEFPLHPDTSNDEMIAIMKSIHDMELAEAMDASYASNLSAQINSPSVINNNSSPDPELADILEQIRKMEEREATQNIIQQQDFEYEESLRQDIAREESFANHVESQSDEVIVNESVESVASSSDESDEPEPLTKEQIRAARLAFFQQKK